MSKVDGSDVKTPSYRENHRPPVSVQPDPTCGAVTASAISTSYRVSQPSWSASIHNGNNDRS